MRVVPFFGTLTYHLDGWEEYDAFGGPHRNRQITSDLRLGGTPHNPRSSVRCLPHLTAQLREMLLTQTVKVAGVVVADRATFSLGQGVHTQHEVALLGVLGYVCGLPRTWRTTHQDDLPRH